MIIGSIDLLLAPCATRVRNCGAKPTVVCHQSLSQFMATNIWGTDQDDGAFSIRPWVVEGDLLVDHRLPLNLDLAGVVVVASAVWHLLLLPLVAPPGAEEALVVLALVPASDQPSSTSKARFDGAHLVSDRLLHAHALAVEVGAWYQTGQSVLLPLPVGLPPVRILLVDHVQDVALVEGDAQLSARHIVVVLRLVVDLGLEVDDGGLGRQGGVRVVLGDRHHQHGEGARHPGQDVTNLVHVLPPQLHLVYLEDLVALVQQSRPVSCTTFDNPPHHDRFMFIFHCGSQWLTSLLQFDNFDVRFRVMRHPVQYHVVLSKGVEKGVSLCQLVVHVEQPLKRLLPEDAGELLGGWLLLQTGRGGPVTKAEAILCKLLSVTTDCCWWC